MHKLQLCVEIIHKARCVLRTDLRRVGVLESMQTRVERMIPNDYILKGYIVGPCSAPSGHPFYEVRCKEFVSPYETQPYIVLCARYEQRLRKGQVVYFMKPTYDNRIKLIE